MRTAGAALVAIVWIAVAAAAATAACGRSDLDLGQDTGGGGTTPNQNGGAGGSGGAGGAGGNAVACGDRNCSNSQFCCVQNGTNRCLADSATCGGARVDCRTDAACAAGQVCCLATGAIGTTCVPAGTCQIPATAFSFCATSAECTGSNICCPIQIAPTSVCVPAPLCTASAGSQR